MGAIEMSEYQRGIDDSRTPLEVKRRASMSIRNKQYGFYPVAKEALDPLICVKCGLEIVGQALNINGRITHYRQCE